MLESFPSLIIYFTKGNRLMSIETMRYNYVKNLFLENDPFIKVINQAIEENAIPNISVNPVAGKLLTMLVILSKAKKVLEIGALAGYSGVCLTKALLKDAEFTSLEMNERYAEIAQRHVREAGFSGKLRYLVGPAPESLEKLGHAKEQYDFIFIDADKENYPLYLKKSIILAHTGTIITADNALWKNLIFDQNDQSSGTKSVREFNDILAKHPKLESLILPFGDGLAMAIVRDGN